MSLDGKIVSVVVFILTTPKTISPRMIKSRVSKALHAESEIAAASNARGNLPEQTTVDAVTVKNMKHIPYAFIWRLSCISLLICINILTTLRKYFCQFPG